MQFFMRLFHVGFVWWLFCSCNVAVVHNMDHTPKRTCLLICVICGIITYCHDRICRGFLQHKIQNHIFQQELNTMHFRWRNEIFIGWPHMSNFWNDNCIDLHCHICNIGVVSIICLVTAGNVFNVCIPRRKRTIERKCHFIFTPTLWCHLMICKECKSLHMLRSSQHEAFLGIKGSLNLVLFVAVLFVLFVAVWQLLWYHKNELSGLLSICSELIKLYGTMMMGGVSFHIGNECKCNSRIDTTQDFIQK